LTVLKTCLEVLVKPNKDLRPRQSEEKAGAEKLGKSGASVVAFHEFVVPLFRFLPLNLFSILSTSL